MQNSVNKFATVWLAAPDPHRKEDRQGLAISDTSGPAMRRSTRGGGQRGFFAPDVAALNTVPHAGSTVHEEGEVPRMPPWGSPGLASP